MPTLSPTTRQDHRTRLVQTVASITSELSGGDFSILVAVAGDARTPAILQLADQSKSKLVVLGMHDNASARRGTMHDVLALGDVAVFAVHSGVRYLPSTVVVGVDFSPSSIRAAHLALYVMNPSGAMHLVFVEPDMHSMPNDDVMHEAFVDKFEVEGAFAALIADLSARRHVSITHSRAIGDPLTQLARACQTIQPNLVVMGRHLYGAAGNVELGHVVRGMIDDGRWSLLLAPPE